jgi:tRNA 2-selenouridine synthase
LDICKKANLPAALDIRSFLQQASSGLPVIDVRTPKEFEHGHIPGAINMPLFSNEERAEVGTLYKQVGRQPAILRGLELVGPKMAGIAREASELARGGPVLIHCWRGGMRSGSVAWLLEMYGLKVST